MIMGIDYILVGIYMLYQIFPVTAFQENCSVVWCEQTKKAAIIDPGGDADLLKNAISKLGISIEKILLTHAHVDHVGAVEALAAYYQVDILGPNRQDQFLLDSLAQQSMQLGFPHVAPFLPTRWLTDGDVIDVGQCKFSVYFCPGHTPGHVVFHESTAKVVFCGDVLFKQSIGRTDFPRGNFEDLIRSIRTKLLILDDDTVVVPGHGGTTTIGAERRLNPFLQ